MAPPTTTPRRTRAKGGLISPPAGPPAGSERVGNHPAIQGCPQCADELREMELPYRIVLRCSHGES